MEATKSYDNVKAVVFAKNPQESQDAYTKWAEEYDHDLNLLDFGLPTGVAKELMEILKDSKTRNTLILDIAAGTGLVGEELMKLGFKGQIDALEANEGLLKVLKKKNIYSTCIQQLITPHGKISGKEGKYDFVTCVGAFIPNHMPPSSVHQMVPLLKSGGVLLYTTRISVTVPEYKQSLDKEVGGLMENKSMMKMFQKDILHFGKPHPVTGEMVTSQLYCYKKL